MRAALPALLALGLGAAAVGCILVTGGTNGYTPSEGGGAPVGAGCTSPSDCSGGDRCCIGFDDAGLPVSACQASCSTSWGQLCARASDCDDAAACLAQVCSIDDASVAVQSCGPIPICVQ